MDCLIKRCEYEELLEVAHLYNELSRELKNSTKEEEVSQIADHTMLRILRSAIKECNLMIYVAKMEDKVIGFISGSIRKAETGVTCGIPTGYVEGAYVSPEYDRETILSKLEAELAKEFEMNRANYHKGAIMYAFNGV